MNDIATPEPLCNSVVTCHVSAAVIAGLVLQFCTSRSRQGFVVSDCFWLVCGLCVQVTGAGTSFTLPAAAMMVIVVYSHRWHGPRPQIAALSQGSLGDTGRRIIPQCHYRLGLWGETRCLFLADNDELFSLQDRPLFHEGFHCQ